MRSLIWLFLTAFLAGCASLVPSALARLTAVSPLSADPEGFVVALDLPPGVAVVPGSATLDLTASRSDTGETLSGRYVLARGRSADGALTYRVAARDLDRLRGLQARIRDWTRENAAATRGSLSVSLTGCRTGDGPSPDATVSVALKTAVDQPFRPLIRDAPLSAIVNRAGSAGIDACR